MKIIELNDKRFTITESMFKELKKKRMVTEANVVSNPANPGDNVATAPAQGSLFNTFDADKDVGVANTNNDSGNSQSNREILSNFRKEIKRYINNMVSYCNIMVHDKDYEKSEYLQIKIKNLLKMVDILKKNLKELSNNTNKRNDLLVLLKQNKITPKDYFYQEANRMLSEPELPLNNES